MAYILILSAILLIPSQQLLAEPEPGTSEAQLDAEDEQNEGNDDFDIISIDDDLDDLDNGNAWYTDQSLSFGSRSYDKSEFTATTVLFTTEWSPENLPVRFGPSFGVLKLKPSGDFYQDGSIFEFGMRVSTFYDMENFLPYISLNYTFFSTGSINGSNRNGNTESSGTVDISNTGADLNIGLTFFIKDIPIFIEASAYASRAVKTEGTITTATVDSSNGITVENSKVNSSENDTFQSIMAGVTFEI